MDLLGWTLCILVLWVAFCPKDAAVQLAEMKKAYEIEMESIK